MLILDQLKAMPPDTIFATGTIEDNPEGINLDNTGKMLRWLATRGGIHDWAIYAHFEDRSIEWIKKYGNKVFTEYNIKKLVPCDDEAFDFYRY